MAQASEAGSVPRVAAVLRFCAVLATTGPLLPATSGLTVQLAEWEWGGRSLSSDYWFGPDAAQGGAWELTYWSSLLLPAILAGLLLRGPRRSTTVALSAITVVLALRLWSAIAWPCTDPFTGEPLPIALPWPTIACYLAAAVALLLAARSPWPSGRHRVVLWAGAAVASLWWVVACRLPIWPSTDLMEGIFSEAADSAWDAVLDWIWDAETTGLPFAVVVLAVAASVTAPGRAGRWAGAVAAGVLLSFALAEPVANLGLGRYAQAVDPALVRWHLVLAALLVMAAISRRRVSVPRFDGLRSLWNRIPRQTRDLVGVVVVVVAAVWIVAATFMPLSS